MSAPTRAPAPGHKRARSGWGGEVRASGRGGRWGNFGSPALSPPPDVLLTRRPWPYAHATHDPRVAALPEEWGGAPGTRIVDFGCGTGAALLAACARWPSAACLGIDICPRTIRRAKVMQCILERQTSQAAGRVDAVPDEHDLPMPWSAMQSAARGGASLRTAMRVAALAGAAHTLARAPCPQASAAIRSNMLPVSVTVEGEVAEPQRSARAAEGVGSRGGGTAALVDPSTTGSRSSNESRAPASMAIVTGVAAVGSDAVVAPTSSVSAEAPCASAPTSRPVFVCRDVVFSKIRCARGWYHLVFCFHVTKWVHLLHGDEGVRRLFQRVYDALAPGGRLVATFQTWDSYARSASICDETGRYYPDLKLRPDAFVEYLLSPAGGFRRLELSTRVSKPSGRGSTQLVVFQK